MCEAIWLKIILEDMGQKQDEPTPIKCNDQSTIKLANNLVYHARSKHIETQHHFVREKVQSQERELQYCNGNDNMTNVFSK